MEKNLASGIMRACNRQLTLTKKRFMDLMNAAEDLEFRNRHLKDLEGTLKI